MIKKYVTKMLESKCDKCAKFFNSTKNLNRPRKWMHTTTSRVRFSKYFITKAQFNNHIVTIHHGQRPYTCKKCPKSYPTSSDLNFHVKSVHIGVRFTCHICGISMIAKKLLKKHVL